MNTSKSKSTFSILASIRAYLSFALALIFFMTSVPMPAQAQIGSAAHDPTLNKSLQKKTEANIDSRESKVRVSADGTYLEEKNGIEKKGKPKGEGSFAESMEYINYLILLAGSFMASTLIANCQVAPPWTAYPNSIKLFVAGMGIYLVSEIYSFITYKKSAEQKMQIDHEDGKQNGYAAQRQQFKKAEGVSEDAAAAAKAKYALQQTAIVAIAAAIGFAIYETSTKLKNLVLAETSINTARAASAVCAARPVTAGHCEAACANAGIALAACRTGFSAGLWAEPLAGNVCLGNPTFSEPIKVGIHQFLGSWRAIQSTVKAINFNAYSTTVTAMMAKAEVEEKILTSCPSPLVIPSLTTAVAESTYTLACKGWTAGFGGSASNSDLTEGLSPQDYLVKHWDEFLRFKNIPAHLVSAKEKTPASFFTALLNQFSEALVPAAQAKNNPLIALGLAAGGIGIGSFLGLLPGLENWTDNLATPAGRIVFFSGFLVLAQTVAVSTLDASDRLSDDAKKYKQLRQEVEGLESETHQNVAVDKSAAVATATKAAVKKIAATTCFTGVGEKKTLDEECQCKKNNSCSDISKYTATAVAASVEFPNAFGNILNDVAAVDKSMNAGDVAKAQAQAQAVNARGALVKATNASLLKKLNESLVQKGQTPIASLESLGAKSLEQIKASALGKPLARAAFGMDPLSAVAAPSVNAAPVTATAGAEESKTTIGSTGSIQGQNTQGSSGQNQGAVQFPGGLFDGNNEEQKAQLEADKALGMNQNYDYGQTNNDINTDDSTNIFQILSVRYLKTGYGSLLEAGPQTAPPERLPGTEDKAVIQTAPIAAPKEQTLEEMMKN